MLGRINPIAKIIAKAKSVGALTLIDGAQAIANLIVDVQALDCDFYVFLHWFPCVSKCNLLATRIEFQFTWDAIDFQFTAIYRVSIYRRRFQFTIQ